MTKKKEERYHSVPKLRPRNWTGDTALSDAQETWLGHSMLLKGTTLGPKDLSCAQCLNRWNAKAIFSICPLNKANHMQLNFLIYHWVCSRIVSYAAHVYIHFKCKLGFVNSLQIAIHVSLTILFGSLCHLCSSYCLHF